MKAPDAPAEPVTRRRTLSSVVASPRYSTFSRPPMPDRSCPSPVSELITHDSSPITSLIILHSAICTLHSRNPFISRFFTVFTFVSPSIHDFHAEKISARLATARLAFLSQVPAFSNFYRFETLSPQVPAPAETPSRHITSPPGPIKNRSGHIIRSTKTALIPPGKELGLKAKINAHLKRTDNLSTESIPAAPGAMPLPVFHRQFAKMH